jgi:hypothetical protein
MTNEEKKQLIQDANEIRKELNSISRQIQLICSQDIVDFAYYMTFATNTLSKIAVKLNASESIEYLNKCYEKDLNQ